MLEERKEADGQDSWLLFVELDWREGVTNGSRAKGQVTQDQDQDQDQEESSRHCWSPSQSLPNGFVVPLCTS